MRRIISLIIVSVLCWTLFDDVIYAQKGVGDPQQEQETKVIDLTADIVYPITLNDTVEVMCLVGNFAAQHNGAIITADSAVRYSDKRLECFGNVLINKNSTYAYADWADYNGELNEVSLYAPIIKVIDGEATLYCYNFRFNTLDNIGLYEGGGVMINGDNIMESLVGYYYADNKELIGVGDVQLSGNEYQMTSDSIIYNTATESATYFENTNIWNQKNEYLYADAGDYDKALDRYSFSLNGYILTDEQEMWGDSMDYFRASEHIYMRNNIQIDDTTQKSLIFGDYGEYIKEPGDIFLTGDPSMINYDVEQGDSLYMRADTFQLFTLLREDLTDSTKIVSATEMAEVNLLEEPIEEELHDHSHDGHNHADHNHDHGDHEESTLQEDIPSQEAAAVTPPKVNVTSQSKPDSVEISNFTDTLSTDSLQSDSLKLDSLQQDSLPRVADTLNFWQRTKKNYLAKRKERAAQKAIERAARKVVLDSIGHERQLKINEKLDAEKVREARRVAQRKAKLAEKETKKIRKAAARGKISSDDTLALISALAVDTAALIRELAPIDSLSTDSLMVDSLVIDSLSVDSVTIDSTYRLTKGYRNVKIYRSDFQAIADSMVTSSIDSIIRLYINPVLWHDVNQVTSDVMDIYTSKNQIEKAIFTGGNPIMASEVEPGTYYNQIAGKVITSLFANGAVYRNNVEGNAQTIYFMQDDKSKEVDGLMDMASGGATFYIEEQQVVGITYRGEPTYTIYPMDMIPTDQALKLKGFEWKSTERPSKDDIFKRVIRPTQREEKSALERPKFPLHEDLEAHKKNLIESGTWLDRNDLVSPHAEEWMESLGYKTGQPREENKTEISND